MSDFDNTLAVPDPENPISSVIDKGLNRESMEIVVAKGILQEELIDTFYNPDLTMVLDKDPVKIFNRGHHDDTLAYDDDDFNFQEEGVVFTSSDGVEVNVREAHSLYERHDLREPRMGKVIRVDHMVYNEAYFPFNSLAAGILNEQKQREVAVISDAVNTDFDSAFDKKVESTTKKEVVSISFDGYIFAFTRFVHSNGAEHIELQIEQYRNESGEERKCLRKSNILEGFGVVEFAKLKTEIENKIRTAKPKVAL